MPIELRQRSFGELLGQCFSLVAAHFVKLEVIVLLFNAPILAVSLWQVWATQSTESLTEEGTAETFGALLTLLLSFIVTPLEQGAAILLVASTFTGDRPTLGECLLVGLRRFWPTARQERGLRPRAALEARGCHCRARRRLGLRNCLSPGWRSGKTCCIRPAR